MRSKPAYTQCRLYYDGLRVVDVGHYLKTPAGSAYLITQVKQHRTRAYRRNLICLRWPLDEIPKRAKVHPLYWYSRKRRR